MSNGNTSCRYTQMRHSKTHLNAMSHSKAPTSVDASHNVTVTYTLNGNVHMSHFNQAVVADRTIDLGDLGTFSGDVLNDLDTNELDVTITPLGDVTIVDGALILNGDVITASSDNFATLNGATVFANGQLLTIGTEGNSNPWLVANAYNGTVNAGNYLHDGTNYHMSDGTTFHNLSE